MPTTLEAPAQSAIPNPKSAIPTRPTRIFLPLTKARRTHLLAFLRKAPRKAGLLLERTESDTLFTYAPDTINAYHATLTIPHLTTQEPAAVQLERHRLYSGAFWLDDVAELITALGKTDPTTPGILTLDFHPTTSRAEIAYTLLGRLTQHPVTARKLKDRTDRSHFTSHTTPFADLRVTDATLNLNATWLSSLLQRTRPAISEDETRYVLNGIYLHFDAQNPHRFRAVSTDGRRLHLEDWSLHPASLLPCHPDTYPIKPIIIPTAAIDILAHFLGTTKLNPHLTGAAYLTVNDTGTHAHFHLPFIDNSTLTLATPAIEGNFPNYTQVIPDRTTQPFTLALTDPAAAARIANTIGSAGSHAADIVHLVIDGTRAYLRGQGNTLHPIATVSGPIGQIDPMTPIVAAYTRPFFIDAIPHFTHIHFADPETPITLSAPHRTHILMPYRLAK